MKARLLTEQIVWPLFRALICLALVNRAAAITDGQPDGDAHPYVGLVVAYYDYVDDDGVAQHMPLWRGSGTLISPRVVVTAAHVVGLDPESGLTPTSMAVYFESNVEGTGYPFSGGHSGAPIPHPAYSGYLTVPDTHDIGAIVLDEPVSMNEYGQLPGLGVLDSLATRRGRQTTRFDVVGYGVQYIRQSPKGIIKLQSDKVRYQGVASLIDLRSALADGHNILLTTDEGKGNGSGGTAFGDSGGPVFLPGTRIMVGITSFASNLQAAGPSGAFRADTVEALEFLQEILQNTGD